MSLFKKAVRHKHKAYIAIHGPSKSGKTTAALNLARGLVGPAGRIAVIDTEHGSASKTCADDHDFDVEEIDHYDPRALIDLIQAAEKGGYDAVVVDSLSHFWAGRGGTREIVDRETAQSNSGNSYIAWAKGTAIQDSLVQAILNSKCHVVCTMRAKMQYALELNPSTGKSAPKKVGLGPIQRNDTSYEFDATFAMNQRHVATVEGRIRKIDDKGNVEKLNGQRFDALTVELGQQIARWLDGGKDVVRPKEVESTTPTLTNHLRELIRILELAPEQTRTILSSLGVSDFDQLTDQQQLGLIKKLEGKVYDKQFKASFPDTGIADKAAAERAKRLKTILGGDDDEPGQQAEIESEADDQPVAADHATAELATA